MHRGKPCEEGELRVVGREIDAASLLFLANMSSESPCRRLHQGPLLYVDVSRFGLGRSQTLLSSGHSIIGSPRSLVSGTSPKKVNNNTRMLKLTSVPEVEFETKLYTNIGRTKNVSIGLLRFAECQGAAQKMMVSLASNEEPRFARGDRIRQGANPARKRAPLMEVLEVEGPTVLGIPATSRVQQYSSTVTDNGRRKHILIAMHEANLQRNAAKGNQSSLYFASLTTCSILTSHPTFRSPFVSIARKANLLLRPE